MSPIFLKSHECATWIQVKNQLVSQMRFSSVLYWWQISNVNNVNVSKINQGDLIDTKIAYFLIEMEESIRGKFDSTIVWNHFKDKPWVL